MPKIFRDIVRFAIYFIIFLLVIRFVLRLLGANTNAQVINWIYVTTLPLLDPFYVAFPSPNINGRYVLEFSTVFAIFFYAFAGWLIDRILKVLTKRR